MTWTTYDVFGDYLSRTVHNGYAIVSWSHILNKIRWKLGFLLEIDKITCSDDGISYGDIATLADMNPIRVWAWLGCEDR